MTEKAEKTQLSLTITSDDDLDTATMKMVAIYLEKNPVSLEALDKVFEAFRRNLAPLFARGRITSRTGAPILTPPAEISSSSMNALVSGDHPKAAVPVEDSIEPEFITCLEDGQKFRSLKRHLRSSHHMTPEQYRAKWGLDDDYPMVAPEYAKRRSDLAKEFAFRPKRDEE